MLANHRNCSAPAQDRTRPIPPSERGRTLRRSRPWLHRDSTPAPRLASPTIFPSINIPVQRTERPLPEPPQVKQYRPALPLPTVNFSGSYDEHQELEGIPFLPFLPENNYLGVMVPTRNRTELQAFRYRCAYLLQHCPDYHITHPIADLFHFCPHPNTFVGFLWRYRITITHEGVLEDYRIITTATGQTSSTFLKRQFTIFYSWTDYSYTTSII